MKVFAKIFCVVTMISVVAGCASNSDQVYVPKIPPQVQAKLLDYFDQPDNKVFIVAIDPSGDFAFAYDYGKSTLKEAAKVAVEKCDASIKAQGIIARPYIYALNNKVVYEDMIRSAQKSGKVEDEDEAQVEEVAEADQVQNPEAADAQETVAPAEEM